jgi:hypothetical protein
MNKLTKQIIFSVVLCVVAYGLTVAIVLADEPTPDDPVVTIEPVTTTTIGLQTAPPPTIGYSTPVDSSPVVAQPSFTG